jgi:hypothetical protein
MKRTLRILALVVGVGAVAWWAAAGAHRGWTRTSEAVKTVDEVTGIEATSYRRRFLPGVDFLGGALLGAIVLGGASLLLPERGARSRHQPIP